MHSNQKTTPQQFCRLLLCCLLLVLPLQACDTAPPATPKSVGIVLFGDSRMPQVEGFRKEMSALGYKEGVSVNYFVHNAKNDRNKLKVLVQEFLDRKIDLLVAAGGLEADTMRKMIGDKRVPVVVLYVNAIIERGLVKSRRKPGWSVTGVDNLNAELSGKRVEILQSLVPDLKRILILYYDRIAPSRIGVEKARETAAKKGIVVDARPVNSREEIGQVMQSLQAGEVDAMLTVPTAPIDNALREIILPHVERLGLPLMTHSRPLARIGALASYGANFSAMGSQAARLADKVLNGIAPENIPFETPKKFLLTINSDVRRKLNIELSAVTRSQVNDYINSRD